jgi:hypothetical protein
MKINELIESRNLIEQQIRYTLETLRKQDIKCECFEIDNIVTLLDQTPNNIYNVENYCANCGRKIGE